MQWFDTVAWPDTVEWVRLGLVAVALAGLIGVGEFLRAILHWPAEVSRKIVHVAVGVGLLFAPRLFISPIPLLILAVVFAGVNYAAIKTGMLRGIHGPARKSYGTVYFPASLFVLTLAAWGRSPELVAVSMFSFSLGDAAAAVVGESLRSPHIYSLSGDQKSFEGSAAMFAATFAAVVAGIVTYWPAADIPWGYLAVIGGAVAVVSTSVEGLSSRGLDNLTVPAANAVMLSAFLLPSPAAPLQQVLLGISLGLVVSVASYWLRFLSASGSVATLLLAVVVFGFGGWKWTMPILAFFVFSSLLSIVGKRFKADLDGVFEKSSTRDHGQVAANGGIAGLLVLAAYVKPELGLYPAYIGAVAAVTADTWGTEVGILARGRTVSVIGFQEVPRGTSGGVSIAGSVAGLAGAAFIGAIGAQWAGSMTTFIAGCTGGVVGALVDSVLGQTLQAQFRCSVCKSMTERAVHCGQPAELLGGVRWLRNDGVNWVCAAAGAAAAGIVAGSNF